MMLMIIIINRPLSYLYATGGILRRSGVERTFSLSVSRAEVASSRSRILGSRMMALAMAMRCF